ncbi:hypothetical protein LSUE1_G008648 [Lachnellula suecica]|uniref:Uncharacterized protein n=1 Tax=Lachnellula suecica TaxID=602035 RepID=A0A8T9BUS4_9HELO|nr:hypothetical protein LSUE1_G008648 [Lachnellula suecica]
MALPRPEASKLFARDIAAYNDIELDQYLEANGRCIKVQDPENLPEDFLQRLRARTGANDAPPSRSIDLNYVSARLVEEPAIRNPSPRRYPSVSSTSTRGSSVNEELYCRHLEEEIESYNALVNDNGRPSHPISLGYDVANNLEEYREILSFWNTSSSDPYGWMVFGPQLHKWKQFRESQRRMRTDGPLEVGSVFPARPAKPGRFAAYCPGLHHRLARHGFERSVQLNEDPDRQDKLTTWIEYLDYEYVQYGKPANTIKRLQQQYDEAWKKLVDSEVLKPFETEESFDYFFWLQLKNEKTGTQKAVESAVAIVKAAEKVSLKAQSAGLSGQGLSQMEQKLSVARSKLVAATTLLEQTSRRCDLIGDFMDQTKPYRIAKDDAAHQSILLRWILQQVPLIELELNPAKVTKTDSIKGKGRHQQSLKRNRADDRNEEPVSKRQKQDGENHTLLESKVRASTVEETSSSQPPRQTQSSRTNPTTLPSKPCSQRALRALRPLNTKSDSVKCGVVLDDSARVSKGKRRNKISLGCTPDSRVLRRSSRQRRPPERFQ